jgi:endonuclease G, mitochondrial
MAYRKRSYRKVTRRRSSSSLFNLNLRQLFYVATLLFGTGWITGLFNRVTHHPIWQQVSSVFSTQVTEQLKNLPQQMPTNLPQIPSQNPEPKNTNNQQDTNKDEANMDLGLPLLRNEDKSRIIKHKYYTLLYSEKHEQAEWVAYKLTKNIMYGHNSRQNDFRPDFAVKTGSALPDDYRGSGYDKGHLAPAGDFHVSPEGVSETFFMSNMSPQIHEFNDGVWRLLEEKVREWVAQRGELYVVTGGILKDGLRKIGRQNKISVPEHYYKVLLDKKNNQAIAFIIPNRLSYKAISKFVVPIDEVEELTGHDFFSSLPDDLEQKLEGASSLKGWFY